MRGGFVRREHVTRTVWMDVPEISQTVHRRSFLPPAKHLISGGGETQVQPEEETDGEQGRRKITEGYSSDILDILSIRYCIR